MKCSDAKYWPALNIEEEVPRLQRSAGHWCQPFRQFLSPPARRVDVNISPLRVWAGAEVETRQKVVIVSLSPALFPPDPTTAEHHCSAVVGGGVVMML